MHTTMVPEQVKTQKIQARVQVSRQEDTNVIYSFGSTLEVLIVLSSGCQVEYMWQIPPVVLLTMIGATLSMGTIQYREDSNEAAFAVAAVEKIYAHESLTFNNTVACEVISKWKAGLKDDMDARSDVYVLSNGCKKCSDDSDGYYWESTPVGSQEYQMVCTRLDIASADVGMLDKFDRGLQTDVQVFVDFDYAMAAYMTLTGAWKKEIWLKGLLAESGYELSLVAGIATGALVKGGSRSEVPAQVEGAAYRY
ncbi:hypothetical protein Tco_1090642 [Tanacetum coccineum]|uniref:Uncharacterized protein n=1 Tax=Tanacetum coccineum TaxID=301880 RepID=A0ABQ5I4U9_9ASTR